MLWLNWETVKRIMPIAVPVVISHMSQTLVGLVDTWMVGKLSVEALAATGLSGVAVWMVMGAASEISTGTQVITSRRWGENRRADAALVLRESLLVALLAGIVFTLLSLFLIPTYFGFVLGSTADPLFPLCTSYSMYRILGLLPFLLISSLKGFFNGIGDTKEHMRVSLLINVVNIFFNWVFIFGHLGAAPMGVAGAGLASCLATLIGSLLFLNRIRARRVFSSFGLKLWGEIRPREMIQLIRLATPASVQTFLVMAGFTFFTSIIHSVGLVEVAATNLIISVMSVSFMPGFAVGIAASTLIGQDLGAGNPGRAREDGNTAQQLAMLLMGAFGILFIAIPETLLGAFTSDSAVLRAGHVPLQVMGFIQAIDALAMTTAGCLRGSGMTLFVMWGEITINWVFFIPFTALAIYVFHAGIITAFVGLGLYLILMALVMQWQWRRDHWQQIEV